MNLMKHKKIYFLISAFFLIPGLISLILFGLKPAIDFTGGSLLEFQFIDEVKAEKTQQKEEVIVAEATKILETVTQEAPKKPRYLLSKMAKESEAPKPVKEEKKTRHVIKSHDSAVIAPPVQPQNMNIQEAAALPV